MNLSESDKGKLSSIAETIANALVESFVQTFTEAILSSLRCPPPRILLIDEAIVGARVMTMFVHQN